MTHRGGSSPCGGAGEAEPATGADRLARYRRLKALLDAGRTDVPELAAETGLRPFEVRAEIDQRALAAITRAKKPRTVTRNPKPRRAPRRNTIGDF